MPAAMFHLPKRMETKQRLPVPAGHVSTAVGSFVNFCIVHIIANIMQQMQHSASEVLRSYDKGAKPKQCCNQT
jgi:hypothetical protein